MRPEACGPDGLPSGDEALVELLRRCAAASDPVPPAVLSRAAAAFDRLHPSAAHRVDDRAGGRPGTGVVLPSPRPWGQP